MLFSFDARVTFSLDDRKVFSFTGGGPFSLAPTAPFSFPPVLLPNSKYGTGGRLAFSERRRDPVRGVGVPGASLDSDKCIIDNGGRSYRQ